MKKAKSTGFLIHVNATAGSPWRVTLAVELFSLLPVEEQDFIIKQIKLLLPTGQEDSSWTRSLNRTTE